MNSFSKLKYFFVFFLFFFPIFISGQVERETRAVWVATNFRLDWPPPVYDTESQKSALIKILNNIKSKNLNTVYFQVRSNGVVLFNSSVEAFSPHLSGTVGKAPDYDPLEFAITEAHKRGLELHAWLNTVRCFSGEEKEILLDSNHIKQKEPGWVIKNEVNGKTDYWLNPALPQVAGYLAAITTELARNYNVDGIQLDFLRYPGKDFNDHVSYDLLGEGQNLDQWRRDNITRILRSVYDGAKSEKPWIKIGVAPFGIYKNMKGAWGTEGYSDVYQDSRTWLNEQILDYVVPQIYWGLEGNPDFEVLAHDWSDNSFDRNVILGIGTYKPEVMKDLGRIIEISREAKSDGVAFFRYGNIDKIEIPEFTEKTYPAAMPWIPIQPASAPNKLTAQVSDGKLLRITLNWSIPEGTTPEYYALYRFNKPPFLFNSSNLFEIIKVNRPRISMAITKPRFVNYYFAVKAIDRLWNESDEATNTVHVNIPELDALLPNREIIGKLYLLRQHAEKLNLFILADRFDTIKISSNIDGAKKELSTEKILPGYNLIELNQIEGGSTLEVQSTTGGWSKSLKVN